MEEENDENNKVEIINFIASSSSSSSSMPTAANSKESTTTSQTEIIPLSTDNKSVECGDDKKNDDVVVAAVAAADVNVVGDSSAVTPKRKNSDEKKSDEEKEKEKEKADGERFQEQQQNIYNSFIAFLQGFTDNILPFPKSYYVNLTDGLKNGKKEIPLKMQRKASMNGDDNSKLYFDYSRLKMLLKNLAFSHGISYGLQFCAPEKYQKFLTDWSADLTVDSIAYDKTQQRLFSATMNDTLMDVITSLEKKSAELKGTIEWLRNGMANQLDKNDRKIDDAKEKITILNNSLSHLVSLKNGHLFDIMYNIVHEPFVDDFLNEYDSDFVDLITEELEIVQKNQSSARKSPTMTTTTTTTTTATISDSDSDSSDNTTFFKKSPHQQLPKKNLKFNYDACGGADVDVDTSAPSAHFYKYFDPIASALKELPNGKNNLPKCHPITGNNIQRIMDFFMEFTVTAKQQTPFKFESANSESAPHTQLSPLIPMYDDIFIKVPPPRNGGTPPAAPQNSESEDSDHDAEISVNEILLLEFGNETVKTKRQEQHEIECDTKLYRNLIKSQNWKNLKKQKQKFNPDDIHHRTSNAPAPATIINGYPKTNWNLIMHGDLWINNLLFSICQSYIRSMRMLLVKMPDDKIAFIDKTEKSTTSTPTSTTPTSISTTSTSTSTIEQKTTTNSNENNNNKNKSKADTLADDDDDPIIDVKYLDCQAFRCTSPLIDVLHVLYTSADLKYRSGNLLKLLLFHYQQTLFFTVQFAIAKSLNHGQIDSMQLKELQSQRLPFMKAFIQRYSMKNLLREYYKKSCYGLGMALWMLPVENGNKPMNLRRGNKRLPDRDGQKSINDKLLGNGKKITVKYIKSENIYVNLEELKERERERMERKREMVMEEEKQKKMKNLASKNEVNADHDDDDEDHYVEIYPPNSGYNIIDPDTRREIQTNEHLNDILQQQQQQQQQQEATTSTGAAKQQQIDKENENETEPEKTKEWEKMKKPNDDKDEILIKKWQTFDEIVEETIIDFYNNRLFKSIDQWNE